MLSQQGGGERGVAEFRSWCLRPETLTSCTRVCSTGWVHFWVKGRSCSERGVSSSLSLCAGAGQLFAASIKLFLQMPPVTNPTHQPPSLSCPKSPFDLARSSQKTVVLDPPFFDPGFFLFESEEGDLVSVVVFWGPRDLDITLAGVSDPSSFLPLGILQRSPSQRLILD